jgi:predicted Zn-dependent protease
MEKSREQRQEILLVPIGKVLVDILGEIAVALRKTYRYHVHIGRSEEPDTEMYSDQRRQYDAERLLDLVAARKRESLIGVLGIVDADMFAEEKSFIFGLNKPEKGIGVVALARLREEFYKKPSNLELFLRRGVTESIYQLGLAMGLPTCVMKKCVLMPTTTLWRLDSKVQSFCDACQTRMEARLHSKPGGFKKKSEVEEAGPESEENMSPPEEVVAADLSDQEKPDKKPEDESEIPAELVEPDKPIAAEAAAMHTESAGPEEPLLADSPEDEQK